MYNFEKNISFMKEFITTEDLKELSNEAIIRKYNCTRDCLTQVRELTEIPSRFANPKHQRISIVDLATMLNKDIMEKYNLSAWQVSKQRKEAGIKSPKRKGVTIDRHDLKTMSNKQLMEKYDKSKSFVMKQRDRYGIMTPKVLPKPKVKISKQDLEEMSDMYLRLKYQCTQYQIDLAREEK